MPPTLTLFASVVADNLIRAGQLIARRYAVVPDSDATRLHARADRWRAHVEQFCFFGNQLRFSQRRMLKTGLCTRPTWDVYTGLLVNAGVMIKIKRSGCYWRDGWDRHKLAVLLRRRMMTLPYPLDEDPPPLFHTRASETQRAQRSQTAQLSTWSQHARPN